MQILIYSYNYHPEPIGIAPLMTELAEGLVKKGHERSEEHTSELQSHSDLVCRLLLEKKKKIHFLFKKLLLHTNKLKTNLLT